MSALISWQVAQGRSDELVAGDRARSELPRPRRHARRRRLWGRALG